MLIFLVSSYFRFCKLDLDFPLENDIIFKNEKFTSHPDSNCA